MIAKVAAAAAFLATVLAANFVTTRYGMWPVGLGLTATAGTYFAGAAFVLRDLVQDLARPDERLGQRRRRGGRATVILLIVVGAALSFVVCSPSMPWYTPGPGGGPTWWRIATASAAAFLLSEAADYAIYQPLRDRGYIRAALASNFAGALLDTVVFLSIAGLPLSLAFWGQLVGKLEMTLVVVAAVVAWRSRRRAVTA